MPSRKIHKLVDKIVFGRSFEEVHKIKDSMSSILGYKHRVYFHDKLSALVLASMSDNPLQVYLASILHDVLDKLERVSKSSKKRKSTLKKPTS